jgi:hypothetical protein
LVPLIAQIVTAHAGGCGELVDAQALHVAVQMLQRQHLHVSFEGRWDPVQVTFRVGAADSASDAANALVESCGAACGDYELASRPDGAVVLRSKDEGRARILDAMVQLPPGERLLSQVATELLPALSSAPEAAQGPVGGVASLAQPSRRVIVPATEGPVPARDLIASLEVVPVRPDDATNTATERVAWIVQHGDADTHQVVGLTVVDTTRRATDDDFPGPGRADLRLVVDAMLKNHPPPGLDAASASILVQQNAAALPAAEAFDTRAADECDP